MTVMKILAGGLGLAALATAAPSTAQYYPYGNTTAYAAQRCAAAVQARLQNRGSAGILGIFGVRTNTAARVVAVTRVQPIRAGVRVRGLATSGRLASYDPYGYGAYGALGYGYAQPAADLSFRCTVDYRGRIRDIDINRR